jgi:hypothetical protein
MRGLPTRQAFSEVLHAATVCTMYYLLLCFLSAIGAIRTASYALGAISGMTNITSEAALCMGNMYALRYMCPISRPLLRAIFGEFKHSDSRARSQVAPLSSA